MSNFDQWCKVENALCKLEQLDTLIQVYTTQYLEDPTPTFAKMAARNHESMCNLAALELDAVNVARSLLKEAIDETYAQARNEKEAIA